MMGFGMINDKGKDKLTGLTRFTGFKENPGALLVLILLIL